jgi:spore maturation protein CgeB
MKILCVLGQHQYGKPAMGVGTEFAAFTSALTRLGHEVAHVETWNRSSYRTYAESNRLLLDTVSTERPDVLLTVQRDYEIWLETLEIIRARGDVATISWTTDDSWKYKRTSRFIGQFYDAMTTTYESVLSQYSRDGIPVLLTQWAANADWLQKPLPASQCAYGVSFVGAAHKGRKEMIAALRRRGIEVECFGSGWPRGPVESKRIPEIMRQSKISLNFSNAFQGDANQIKARTFEVPGAGGLLLTDFAPGLDRLYEIGMEVVVYQNEADLAAKISWLQKNPKRRDEIALAGFLRTERDHTYDQRMKEVLSFALASKRKRGNVHFSGQSFELAESQHRLRPWQSRLRNLLVGVSNLIWGRERGPRAARRLAFEVSLRVFGQRTYRAAGLPGRMFPEQ